MKVKKGVEQIIALYDLCIFSYMICASPYFYSSYAYYLYELFWLIAPVTDEIISTGKQSGWRAYCGYYGCFLDVKSILFALKCPAASNPRPEFLLATCHQKYECKSSADVGAVFFHAHLWCDCLCRACQRVLFLMKSLVCLLW